MFVTTSISVHCEALQFSVMLLGSTSSETCSMKVTPRIVLPPKTPSCYKSEIVFSGKLYNINISAS